MHRGSVLFWETGGDIVIDISELDLEVMCLNQDLSGALVGVLPSSHQLGAGLQQWRKQVLDAHTNLLLTALLVPLRTHYSCRQGFSLTSRPGILWPNNGQFSKILHCGPMVYKILTMLGSITEPMIGSVCLLLMIVWVSHFTDRC